MAEPNLISVIIPVHNQADHIERLVQDYLKVTKNLQTPCEFILVVNNCNDSSPEICEHLAQQDKRARVIKSDQGGWGFSVKLGIKNALGEIICYTNSARTQPQDLLLFLQYALTNPHIVIKADRKFRDNWRRRLGSLIYNLEIRYLFDVPYWDINGTPKVFPRSFEKLLQLKEDGDLIDAEFIALCRWQNYPVIEIPILSVARQGGKSTTNYRSAISMYLGAIELWQKMGKPNK